MSGHGGRLVECLDYAMDRGLADVFLVAYNFTRSPDFFDELRNALRFYALQPDLPARLARARGERRRRRRDETLAGARLNDMRPFERPGGTFAQAAFRWVLADPNVDALVVSMTSRRLIDEYVAASGAGAPSGADRTLLERYLARNGDSYCRPACGACADACPEGVAIADALRARMYAEDYGDEALARETWAAPRRVGVPCPATTGPASAPAPTGWRYPS